MSTLEIVLIGFCLAIDAFAISICKGLSMNKFNIKKAVIIAFYFGVFQGVMPFVGYSLGLKFYNFIINIDHWLAFFILLSIGLNMIKNVYSSEEAIDYSDSVSFKTMLPLSLATSIDALTIGITFSFLKINIIKSSIIIFLITFLLSFIGVFISNKFNTKIKEKSQLIGGIFIIILGLKILLEHLSN